MSSDLRDRVGAIVASLSQLQCDFADVMAFDDLDDLKEALGNKDNQLIDHVMNVDVLQDSELFHLLRLISSYVADTANNNNLLDSDRVELTATCEFLLEALSSAPLDCGTRGGAKPISGKPCVCGGAGTQEAEIEGLRRLHMERLDKIEAVLSKVISTLLFILKYAIKRESLPSASRHARELEDVVRKAGIRGGT